MILERTFGYLLTLSILLTGSVPLLSQDPASDDQDPSANASGQPIDLQEASIERLVNDLGLDRIPAIRLIEYREEFGPIRSFYELHYIEGFSPSRIERIKENAHLQEASTGEKRKFKDAIQRSRRSFRIRWKRDLPQRNGYRNGRFLGSPDAMLGQFRWEIPGYGGIGLSAEKDAGEPWLDPNTKLPDASGGHLEIGEHGVLERLVVGNLRTTSGGGLLMSGGSNFSGQRLPESGPLFRIAPFTGSPERSPMRGGGIKLRKKGFRAGLLYSRRERSARIDTMDGSPFLRTLYRDGLHRRPERLAKKGAWVRDDMVAHLGYRGGSHSVSSSLHYGRASHERAPPRWIREYPQRRGRTEKGLELHYRGNAGRERWELSVASDEKGRKAYSGAFSSFPHDDLFLWFNIQGAEWGFAPYHSGSSRDGRPFVSLRMGGEKSLGPGWRMRSNFRLLYRQWPYFQRKGPGSDRSLRTRFIHQRGTDEELRIGLRYTARERDERGRYDRPVRSHTEERLQSDLNWDGKLGPELQSRIRVQGHHDLQGSSEPGVLFSHDLIREWEERGMKAYWRIAYFEAPDYETRNYAYENDLLYAFSIPLYYRTGMRSYLLARVELSDRITLEGKVGLWAYLDPEDGRIGSGAMSTEGPYRSDLGLQLRGSF